jgi:hypothetical protein
MALSEDMVIHVMSRLIAQIRQNTSGEERHESEDRHYSLNRTFESQAILGLALQQYARHQGHTITGGTGVVPLPSGEIEVRQPKRGSSRLNVLS